MQLVRLPRLAEFAPSRSELEFRRLLEKLPAAAYTCDADGLITYCNRHAVQLWGREPKLYDPVDRFCGSFRLFSPDGLSIRHEQCWMARTLNENTEYNGHEIVIERPDGSRLTVLAHANPFHDERGNLIGAVNVLVDITDRKQAERQAQEAREVAETANRAKDQFLAALSHELRTPLTPVLMGIASLETDARLHPELRDEIRMIRRNAEMEARLIDDLLDLTRIVQGKLELKSEVVDAHSLIHHAVNICRADIEAKGLGLTLDLRARRNCVPGDAARLQQVLWNLVKNAVKFTPAGGSITVSTEDAEGGHLLLRVIDTGIGITPDVLPRLFAAFEQGGRETTQQFGGLGLGLAISKALVEAHGGTLTAHSEGRDTGATFSVVLVGAEYPGLTSDESSRVSGRNGQANSLRILLVEDHKDTSRIMARMLNRSGHEVTTAEDIASALDAASAKPFDLLISDLGLPDGSGLNLMQRLRPMTGIALTGYGMEADIAKCQEAGFAAHLTKPIDFAKLDELIQRVAR